ncbi:MAG: hydroxylamine reductase [Desulfobacteraceae bacterium]|jgi:hydroxylamine reductase|nr:hydroxylamine reductase [Desulfobacteraceae bacterium]MDH3720013.1 hydroxylamine reductase [Desulfobacteraceae bacterium]MDH3836474.1 hydroxylamine reductase [Desulfobacteraceae bacterium]MDH3873529.1 hydroxylamine reductase [Desulfobacteraceae bacterium]MDH3956089.1 hydroxylamine reductase [Desulfobacteraceae bacterium]
MFCYQCEQTAKGTGCTVQGVCGKMPEVAALQDLLLYTLMGLSQVAVEGRKVGVTDRDVNIFTVQAAFSTLTNVDFDPDRFKNLIHEAAEKRDQLKAKVKAAGGNADLHDEPAKFNPQSTLEGLVKQGETVGLKSYPGDNPDILSLKHTVLFGIKGVSAYADHAQILGEEDDNVYAYIHEGLAAIQRDDLSLEDWVGLTLKCGEAAFKAMELLDAGNTGIYGHPVPTQVPLGHKKGNAILVSGHDLKDLEELLKQTQGKGIYIYTHGEMLSTHGYPKLKKYEHFYGQFGTAWQKQIKEFSDFPGAILMTTNCIQRPKNEYKDNIFTSGMVGWPGVPHISDLNFQPVIDRALALPGFQEDEDAGEVTVGFARNAVLGVADKVIEAVKKNDIRHFFLVAGCDGAKPGRNYYTEFVEKVPKDCIVLTLACGKYRFFDKDLGDIGGIPRLLDAGQCNDAYSAVQIAVALANAFNVDVNELPLSLIISWYEQKAVCVLLALLHLGIKGIRLGPSLPAFLTPNVLDTLVKNFDIKPIATPDEDLKAILG